MEETLLPTATVFKFVQLEKALSAIFFTLNLYPLMVTVLGMFTLFTELLAGEAAATEEAPVIWYTISPWTR